MRTVYSLRYDWRFIKNMTDPPATLPENGEKIELPHTWNAADGQDGGNDYFRGTCCYARQLSKRELPAGEVYYLEINGANSSSGVYMNGKRIAHHDGGYSTYRVDITPFLREENCLVVMVDNSENDRVYPQMADFTFYGGLYRDVNIIAVAQTHFAMLAWGTPGIHVTPVVSEGNARVKIATQTEHRAPHDLLRFEILDADDRLVCFTEGQEETAELCIEGVHLWHGVRDPYLYTAKVAILRDGIALDEVKTRFGCRSFEIDPARGFILNGESYPLRGVSRHQDRKGIGNALLPEHHREDMDLIRELGANTIRLAHYQHDRYFYDLCDEYGMVVWAEIPYISRHMSTGNENAVSQMRELITQCDNHPSIVVWGLSNEITMDGANDPDLIRFHRTLNDLVHQMDPTRLTTLACLSVCSPDEEYVHITDVVSYNHYFGWYGGTYDEYGPWFDRFHETYPNLPVGISEYGCEALNWHSSSPEAGDYTEEYQARYHEALILQLYTRPYLWAVHLWNMFDFGADARAEGGENGQNHKGLVTFDRQYKKDAFYAYRAWLSETPFVHLCGKRYVDRVEEVTDVTVYSNLPEVELFADGVSVGKVRAEDHFFRFRVKNEGETVLCAVAGEWRDESRIRRVAKMNPDYILREQGAVLNWFDIKEREGYFSLNDKIGEITGTLRGRLWMLGLLLTLSKKQKQADRARENRQDGNSGKKGTRRKKGKSGQFGGEMLKMLNSFTVLRLSGMLGIKNITFTKEELLKMNRKLNRIRKPEKK